MVTFVLDASALIRYMESQAGADRVAEILLAQTSKNARVVMSVVNWGEVTTMLLREHGLSGADQAHTGLNDLRIDIIAATAHRAVRSAEMKYKYKIPSADAFCVELATGSEDHILVTADFDFKPAEHDISIEFLQPKPRP